MCNGKIKRELIEFIDKIPDIKLEGFSDSKKKIWKDDNYRLVMQGITNNDEWNLQIRVNKDPNTRSIKKLVSRMVSGPVLVPKTAPISPDEIRELFKATLDLNLS